jgi:K+/H+ antiporter YhaU regulatory subunit KhtT
MLALCAVLFVMSISLLIVRIGAIALAMTGLSPQIARFQARSAYFGVGFTTVESEKILSNPVRREIALALMLFGNAGFISVVGSLVLALLNTPDEGLFSQTWFRVTFIAAGVCLLYVISYSRWIDRQISTVVQWALRRWTKLEAQDYSEMLHLAHHYSVAEFPIQEGDWLANRTLMDLRLGDEGVMILGIERAEGGYIGAPKGSVVVRPGDDLIVYGKEEMLKSLERRRAGQEGDEQHQKAVDFKQSHGIFSDRD